MSEVIRIIAAVVDTQRLTLYKQDGTTILVPQGDSRIRPLVDKVIPALEADKFCDLTTEDLAISSHYNEAQAGMGGFVQFFRMFKNTIEDMLNKFADLDAAPVAPVAPVVAGDLAQASTTRTASQDAVSEIMAHATPVSSPAFHAPMGEDETLVAVTSSGGIIPGIEKIDVQIQAVAGKLGSAEGVKNFFERVSKVQRRHSVQDLLTFMEKGELPIANDGTVLVYKRLRSTSEDGVFVDCYSKNVKQKVGSKVFMSETLVDPDRSTECSNGLHVARRDYLGSFSGDVCVLAKLAPEDVIAVPHRDPRKLRAKGYHIIAQLSREDADLVCSNRPMKDTVLLGNAAAGNHVGVLETVEITGHYGSGLIITPVAEATEVVMEETKQAVSLDELPAVAKEGSSVDAGKVAKQVVTERKSGRQQQAETLLKGVLEGKTGKVQIQKAKELLAFKKAAKVSWDKLGISESQVTSITAIAHGTAAVAEVEPVKASTITKPKKAAEQVMADWVGTPRERIRKLIDDGIKTNASNIVSIKKAAKKSWSALGVTDAEEKQILSAA